MRGLRCGRSEGEGAMVQHELGEVGRVGLDAKVAEHGVRFPALQELNFVWVLVGAE